MTNPKDHENFFAGKKLKASYIGDDEQAEEVAPVRTEADEKQGMRRIEKLSAVVEQSLTSRVDNPGGDMIMRVTHDEFMKMKDDPKFKLFSQYMNLILNYADGRPRPHPIRPFMANELGMYTNGRGEVKIVILTNNPGDGAIAGTIMQVPDNIGIRAEPDPFPSPSPTSPRVLATGAAERMRLIAPEEQEE